MLLGTVHISSHKLQSQAHSWVLELGGHFHPSLCSRHLLWIWSWFPWDSVSTKWDSACPSEVKTEAGHLIRLVLLYCNKCIRMSCRSGSWNAENRGSSVLGIKRFEAQPNQGFKLSEYTALIWCWACNTTFKSWWWKYSLSLNKIKKKTHKQKNIR